MPFCFYHPKRETTGVFCGKCEKPLCPDCVRHGPTGAVRCRDCLRLPAAARDRPRLGQLAAALGAGGAAALAGASLLGLIRWRSWMLAFLYGLGVGSAVFYASRRRRAAVLQGMALLLTVLGMIAAPVFEGLFHASGAGIWGELSRAFGPGRAEQLILSVVFAAIGAIVRFRWQ
jgi:hypothetical protein